MRRLQGIVREVLVTDDVRRDEDGETWRKCIVLVQLTGLSKRAGTEELPPTLRDKVVKVVRWCCYDWHFKVGCRATLTPEETEAVLRSGSISP
ncbi:MAG: hypothetical protein QXY49_01285 [Thermofilaceae archaeon]